MSDIVAFGPFKRDKDGNLIKYRCPVCGKWLPVNRNKRHVNINLKHYEKHRQERKK